MAQSRKSLALMSKEWQEYQALDFLLIDLMRDDKRYGRAAARQHDHMQAGELARYYLFKLIDGDLS